MNCRPLTPEELEKLKPKRCFGDVSDDWSELALVNIVPEGEELPTFPTEGLTLGGRVIRTLGGRVIRLRD